MSRAPSSCVSQPPAVRETARFVEEYKRLALQYSLSTIDLFEESGQCIRNNIVSRAVKTKTKLSGSLSKTQKPRHWLVDKLSKNTSPQKQKTAGNTRLPRKNSIGSLLSRPARGPHQVRSLDSIFRLGGFSALHLTSSKRHIEFFIPTPLAATAQYLLKHGIRCRYVA